MQYSRKERKMADFTERPEDHQHTAKIRQMLSEVAEHAREDVEKSATRERSAV
jgi:hypothetical protein